MNLSMHEGALEMAMAAHRPLLFKLCYRMTGCAADADDLVQETFARALATPPSDLSRDPRPWLVQVAVNLSRDHLRRRKRLQYIGPWLPSPLETPLDAGGDRTRPDVRYGELESLSTAFLIALEALSATQRAVLVLRDVLGYSVEEAAEALALSESNVKTTHHRARAALERYDQARAPITKELQTATRNALNNLMWCLLRGDVEGLRKLLAEDVQTLNDGNGEYFAAKKPVIGRERVILFHQKTQRIGQRFLFATREINGLPALVADIGNGGNPRLPERMVITIELNARGEIQRLDGVVASRKLTHVSFDFGQGTGLLGALVARARAALTDTRAGKAVLRAVPGLRAPRG